MVLNCSVNASNNGKVAQTQDPKVKDECSHENSRINEYFQTFKRRRTMRYFKIRLLEELDSNMRCDKSFNPGKDRQDARESNAQNQSLRKPRRMRQLKIRLLEELI